MSVDPTCNMETRAKRVHDLVNGTKDNISIGLLLALHQMTKGSHISEKLKVNDIEDFESYLRAITGDENITTELALKSNNEHWNTLINAEIVMASIASISMKKKPSDLRKLINEVSVFKDEGIGRGSINEIVGLYAAEYGRAKWDKSMDWVSRGFAFVAAAFTQYNKAIFSNINKIYDRHLKSSVIYTDSSDLINATEVIFGREMESFNDIQKDLKDNTFIKQDIANKYFHLMDRQYVDDEITGPHEVPVYSRLRKELSSDPNVNKTGSLNDKDLDIAVQEMVLFKQGFDKFNYGIGKGERIWFDDKTDTYMVYTTGRNEIPGKAYNVDNYPNSHLWYIKQLGEKAVDCISNTRNTDSLNGIEKQLISSFSKEKSDRHGLEYTGHKIKLDYVPIDTENGIFDLAGSFNNTVYTDIPKLSFLKERNGWSTKSDKQGFIDNFHKELAMMKMVFSNLSQYELMQNTRHLLNDIDFVRDKSDYELQVFNEIIEANAADFRTDQQNKSEAAIRTAKVLSLFNILNVTQKLSKPTSAFSNRIGGHIAALSNQYGLDTFQYSKAKHAWKSSAQRNITGVTRSRIETIVDGLMSPFSRQEAAIHNPMEEEATGKAQVIVQKFADASADYGMFGVPHVIFNDIFNFQQMKPFFDTIKKSPLSLRQSEKNLRGDYWKGVVLQLVEAKIANNKDLKEHEIDKLIADTTDKYKYLVSVVERRVHGDFSQTAKSPAIRLGMSNAETVAGVLKGFALATTLMFKNVEFYSVNSAIGGMVAAGYKFNETHDIGDLATSGAMWSLGIAGAALASSALGAPSIPFVSSVNLLQAPMTMSEIGIMLMAFGLNGQVSDEEWNVMQSKLIRLSGGITFGPMMQAQLREIGPGEPYLSNFFPSMIAFNDPLRVLSSLAVANGVVQTGESSAVTKMRVQAKNTIATTPLVGDYVANLSTRVGNASQVVRDISRVDFKGASKVLGDWLIGSELGLRINSGEFMWGLEKGKLVQQNLINNLRPISDDAYSLLNIGGE